MIKYLRRLIKGLNVKVLFQNMATVVSKGMKWTEAAATKAAQNHQYIKLGPKPGYLLLSGAPGRWKKPETSRDVYIPQLRAAGDPTVLRRVFNRVSNFEAILADGYNASNYNTTKKPAFDAEIAMYKQYKASKDAAKAANGGPSVTLDRLQYLVDNVSQATTVARTTSTSPRGTSPRGTSPRRRAGRVPDLAKRLQDAKRKGKVLDVSNMDLVKGTGIKLIKTPGEGSKKIGVAGLEIVSSKPEPYASVVQKLGPQFSRYIDEWNRLYQSKNMVAPMAVPVASTLGQSVGSPVAALPTLPIASSPLGSPLAGGMALPLVPGTPPY